MSLPKHILYPVDFSNSCRAFWPAVEDMARRINVPVTMIHALDLDRFELPEIFGEFKPIRDAFQEKLNQFPNPALELPNVRRELADGNAAASILQCAAALDTPLIMMSTRGHTRFRQLLLGSVTAAVLHDAACPVWTQAHTESHLPHTGVYQSIVCAIDMGPQTPGVLTSAREFSRQFGARLHVVHSIPGIDPRFPSATADRAHAFLIDRAREDFPVLCRKAGVDATLEILEDVGMVDGIVWAAAKYHADLLTIGRGVMQGPLGRLRTNAHELIRRSPCAVLSV